MLYSGNNPNYESFYQGGFSSMSPEYGNYVGYRLPVGKIGQTLNPTTANQLAETMKGLKTGVKEIEIQMLGVQDVDQQIPKEHFKEMRQLLKISGASGSLHAPVVDPSGFSQQAFDETERQTSERRFIDAIEKAHELNPTGNTSVVFHGANGAPGHLFKVDESKKIGEEGRIILERSYAVNQETGQIAPLKREQKFYPHYPEELQKGGVEMKPMEQIRSINRTEWENKLTELAQFNKHADEIFGDSRLFLAEFNNASRDLKTNRFFDNKTGETLKLSPEQNAYYSKLRKADIFLENVTLNFSSAFDKAYKYGTNEQKEALRDLADSYTKKLESISPSDNNLTIPVLEPLKKQEILNEAIYQLNIITQKKAPELFVSSEDYAKDKASETFSNVALESYKEYGKTMPIMALENWSPGTAFNRAEDLKELIKETRNKFAKGLVKKEHMSLAKAEKIAKKQIGATWDLGHLNMMKKHGFSDEELAEETARIALDVKELHLTDNFGFSDSHLVPGMGNVPFKKHLEKLEKAGVLDKVRKVIEAGGYIQQISQKGVHGETAAAFGSPIYGAKMASYWNQALDIRGNYFGGYGNINPPIHHANVYGAGFTTLPMEVGGNIPGGGSRFSGNSIS